MPFVASSNILRVEYDEKKQTMTIQFAKTGAIYDYFYVPREIYEGLLAAPSPGSYLHNVIKNRFMFMRVA